MLLWASLAPAQPASTGPVAPAPGFDVRIDAPPEVQDVLQRHLDLLRYRALTDLDALELDRLARAAEQDARALLATLGYFSPTVSVKVRPVHGAAQTRPLVEVSAQPGAPTTVTEVTLAFAGAAATLPLAEAQRQAIRGTWAMPAGTRFTQARWDEAKALALRQLSDRHFPLAQVAQSRADVDPETRSARLSLTLDSGQAFRFGVLRIQGLQRLEDNLVERIARLRPGTPYDHALLLEAQQRLQDSGYFDAVFLSLQTDADPLAAPVQVTLRETLRHKLVLGVGASTDSGPRLSVEHTTQQLPVLGWRAISRLVLDRSKQQLGTELGGTPDEASWRWVTGAQFKNDDSADVKVRSLNLRAGRTKAADTIDRNYFVEYDRSRSDDAGQITRARSLSASYAWTLRQFDSLPFPSGGYGLGAELGAGITLGGHRDPFLRAQAHWLGVWPLRTGQGRVTARAQAGAVLARDSAVLPNTQLFLTGGDATVRGYAYHDIGTTSSTGQTTPGRYLVNGGLEWQRPILVDGRTSDWESTAFVDAGSVADRPGDFRAKVGIGAGARWKSPVGPLQMDLAYGLAVRRMRLHLTVGFTF